jgi:outer membrane murein-binding lipoprotein Lpp
MMTRAEGAYLGAVRAFQNPMLDLLHKRHAPLVVSLLSTLFTAERPTVPVADAHAEVGTALEELRAAGYEEGLPTANARDLCRQWADAGWLVRQVLDDDVEVYRLSAHAVGALEVAGRAGGARARVSRSRVRTLLDAVERLAQDADPDVLVRMARLDAEIARLRAELVEIQRTGTVEEVDEEQLLEEAENVLHLVRELPADFARVAESIKAMQRDVVTALRQDERPTGEVLREYLERGEHVMESTAEGRAFAGALRLIGDAQHLDELSGRLDVVLRHPFTRHLLPQQRGELRDVVRRIEQGLDQVFTAQREASYVITAQVRNHDPLRDRQVDELLRDVMRGLQAWTPDARRGHAVEPLRRLPVADVDHLRQTAGDLRPPQAPSPLAAWDDDGGPDVSDDEARAWGGAHYQQLREHLAGLAAGGGAVDVAAAFDAAPEQLRRPVDLLGLIELAHELGMDEQDDVASVVAVRPDGTRRRFAFGAVTARVEDADDD